MATSSSGLLALRKSLVKAQADKRVLERKLEKLQRDIAKKDDEITDLQNDINEAERQ